MINFSIAGITIGLLRDSPVIINDGFRPFVTDDKAEFEVIFHETDTIGMIDCSVEKQVFSNFIFSVYQEEKEYYRVFHDHKESDRRYAYSKFLSDSKEEIWYQKDSGQFFSETHNVFSHIALEEILLSRNAMILHSSFIDTTYGGVLFSGPSGVGKSTQADLWIKYRKARLINGDRTILRKSNNEWNAYGSPYAGSSKCYVNDAKKVSAIVMLEQAEKCSIKRLSLREAFIRLYAGMIVNTWNREYIVKLSALIEEMIKEVPVYLFSCTADENAVEILDDTLRKEADSESNRNKI